MAHFNWTVTRSITSKWPAESASQLLAAFWCPRVAICNPHYPKDNELKEKWTCHVADKRCRVWRVRALYGTRWWQFRLDSVSAIITKTNEDPCCCFGTVCGCNNGSFGADCEMWAAHCESFRMRYKGKKLNPGKSRPNATSEAGFQPVKQSFHCGELSLGTWNLWGILTHFRCRDKGLN